MDLAEISRIMRRRWYVLVPGLLLTAVLTGAAYLRLPVTYQSQSTVALLNSQKATAAFDGNPFLSTQTSLNAMADGLARNLDSDDALAQLHARGATGTTAAKLADNALGPLLWLTATGTDKAAVLRTDRLLTSYAAERLREFQEQQAVAPRAMIRMTTIVPPQSPVAKTKTRTEYLVLAGLTGGVISMVATFWTEARRRAPASGRAAPGSGPTAVPPSSGADAAASAPPAARVAPRGSAPDGEDGLPGGGPDSAPGAGLGGTADGGPGGSGPAESGAPGTEAHRFV